jgi:catechol 2,3-dioxygenase-like lactoylglutathione lyase family enzyme
MAVKDVTVVSIPVADQDRAKEFYIDTLGLTARGVRFEGPPKEQPWATETVFYDVDGNGIVLQQA